LLLMKITEMTLQRAQSSIKEAQKMEER